MGQQERALAAKAANLSSDSENPRGRRRELTHMSCSWTSTHTHQGEHPTSTLTKQVRVKTLRRAGGGRGGKRGGERRGGGS